MPSVEAPNRARVARDLELGLRRLRVRQTFVVSSPGLPELSQVSAKSVALGMSEFKKDDRPDCMTKPSLCRQACRRVDHARVDVEVCMCHRHVHMQVSSRWMHSCTMAHVLVTQISTHAPVHDVPACQGLHL